MSTLQKSRDDVIDSCKKLYAMSQDESSPNEAAIALRRVRRQMDQYGITDAELQDSEFDSIMCFEGVQIPKWFKLMSIAVAQYNDCICDGVRRNKRATFEFKGFKQDTLMANLMMDYLTQAMNRGWENFDKDADVHGKAARSSFSTGFASVVQDRLFELCEERVRENQEQVNTTPGTALVADKMKAVSTEFGKQRTSRSRHHVSDGGAYNQGQQMGYNVSLNKQVTGAGQKQLS